MLKRGLGRSSVLRLQLASCLLSLFFSLLSLPNLAGAETVAPGGPPGFDQAADSRIRFDVQENLSSAVDDKYWKDFFKTNELTGTVYALLKDGAGNIYVGGDFITAGGVIVNHIAKWDGTKWSALGTGVFSQYGSSIQALAMDGAGNLYAGGSFTNAGGVLANHIAKWDGTTWSALGTAPDFGVSNTVYALALDGGKLYAGGNFSTAGGVPANRIAKWDGTVWSALGTAPDIGVSNTVNALAVDGGNLYAGGNFSTAGGVAVNRIAKWDGTAWSALGTAPDMGVSNTVNALAVDGGNLYAGGSFSTAGGVAVNRIAKWDGTVWSALGTAPNMGVSNTVNALAVDGGNLYAGGSFSTAGGVTVNRIAKWDGTAWSALKTGIGEQVNALAVSGPGKLYVGGNFKKYRTSDVFQANSIAVWDGTNWSTVTDGVNHALNDVVYALANDKEGNLYAGGMFYCRNWNENGGPGRQSR